MTEGWTLGVKDAVNAQAVEDILGYGITTLDEEACVDLVHSWIDSDGRGKRIVCANPHSLEVARRDAAFAEAIRKADLVLPDGVGVCIASMLLGGVIRKRITGSDVFEGVTRRLNEEGGRSVFFLGSTKTNLSAIRMKMERDFPNVRVAGIYAPPFKRELSPCDDAPILEAVNRARPDVLWVGMCAPKQEKWMFRHKDALDVKVIGGIGAVFDFYSGRVRRSHPFFRDRGLEWLPRLLQEPERLWDRMLISAPGFMARVLEARLREGKRRPGQGEHG